MPRSLVSEAADLNIVEWIIYPRTSKKERGVTRWLRQIPVRGMSCKLGEIFAQEKTPEWAQVMLAHIQMKREAATAPCQAATDELLAKASAVYAATIF